jgi:hypothetical protein
MGDIDKFSSPPVIKDLPSIDVSGNKLRGFVFINYINTDTTKYIYYWPGSGINFRRNTYVDNIDTDAGFTVSTSGNPTNAIAFLHWNNCIITCFRTGGRIYLENIARNSDSYLNFNFNHTFETSPALASGSIVRGMAIYSRRFYILYTDATNNNKITIYSVSLKTLDVNNSSLSCFDLAKNSDENLIVGSTPIASGDIVKSTLTYTTTNNNSIYLLYNTFPVPTGMITFDADGNLYVTTAGAGVFKYSAGFNVGNTIASNARSDTTNPQLLISPSSSTDIFSTILYSNWYRILYIVNYTNTVCSINVYKTDGTLVKKDYISNITTIPNSGIHMYEDPLGVLYYTDTVIKMAYQLICFKEDTQILTKTGYKLIQELKEGDLVKTFQSGYKPIYKIGYNELNQPSSEERIKNQLYKCSTKKFPELIEDLVITGCHCILVDEYKNEKEREEANKINNVVDDIEYITEDMYRLPACVDKRTTVYESAGVHKIYHFALENEDYYMNYGVYANGLLVESTSKRFMDESFMIPLTYH